MSDVEKNKSIDRINGGIDGLEETDEVKATSEKDHGAAGFACEIMEKFGVDRQGVLFAACCLAAAPLLQAAWVFVMYHFVGFPVYGPWHTFLGYLYLYGRMTVLPLAAFIATVLGERFTRAGYISGIAISIITAWLGIIRWDYLIAGVYIALALLLVIILTVRDN